MGAELRGGGVNRDCSADKEGKLPNASSSESESDSISMMLLTASAGRVIWAGGVDGVCSAAAFGLLSISLYRSSLELPEHAGVRALFTAIFSLVSL